MTDASHKYFEETFPSLFSQFYFPFIHLGIGDLSHRYGNHCRYGYWLSIWFVNIRTGFCMNDCLTLRRFWLWYDISKSLPGCGQSLQHRRCVPETAHRVRINMHQAVYQVRHVQPVAVQQGPTAVLWPGAGGVHARAALLPLQRHGLLGETSTDHSPQLLLRGRRETQLPFPNEDLQGRLCVQVSFWFIFALWVWISVFCVGIGIKQQLTLHFLWVKKALTFQNSLSGEKKVLR